MEKVYSDNLIEIEKGRKYWNVWLKTLYWAYCKLVSRKRNLKEVIRYSRNWVKKENKRQTKLREYGNRKLLRA